MYKVGDIVMISSCAGEAIPVVEVRLVKRIDSKEGWTGWECDLTKSSDAKMLRKEWGIPFKFPDQVRTFAYEDNIVRSVKKKNRRGKKTKSNKKTI